MKQCIAKLIEGTNLTGEEATVAMGMIMSGGATESQIAAFLTAIRMKGETMEELVAFASIMRKLSVKINPKVSGTLVDTCGTGGSLIKLPNVSTTAALIAAGTGVAVAKHGNRSATGRCGSADVLEALGMNLEMPCAKVEMSIEQIGLGFMFAPIFHPAMKKVAGVRKAIGARTVFNLLGPLTNPANAKAQLLGVYSETLTERLANTLYGMGVQYAMVVHGLDGLDEISTIGKTKITLLKEGAVSTSYVCPRELGVSIVDRKDIEGSTPHENALTAFHILHDSNVALGKLRPKLEISLVNAAAAIQLGGEAETFGEAMEAARESVESGSAYEKLRSLISFSGGDMSKLEDFENGRFY